MKRGDVSLVAALLAVFFFLPHNVDLSQPSRHSLTVSKPAGAPTHVMKHMWGEICKVAFFGMIGPVLCAHTGWTTNMMLHTKLCNPVPQHRFMQMQLVLLDWI